MKRRAGEPRGSRAMGRRAWTAIGSLLVLLAGSESVGANDADQVEAGASLEKPGPETGREGATARPEAAEQSASPGTAQLGRAPVVAYVPPSRGQARLTAGAGTRARSSALKVAVLAPSDHVALTTRAQPTLYWFVSADTDTRIDLTIVDEASIDPILEITLPGPVAAGIQRFDLSQVGISLDPGRSYRWYVALVHDGERRSKDSIAGGAIERTFVSSELEQSLESARFAYAPYARSGIWYDAIDELQRALERDPDDERLQRQRAALLEQVELGNVAPHAGGGGRSAR